MFICRSSVRICFPCNRTNHKNTDYITKALTERLTCINSDINSFKKLEIDFIEPMKPLGRIGLVRCLQGSQQPYQVVANTVAALPDISESHPNSTLLDLNPQNINKLLTALNECTEWGQVFILDCLSNYNPKDDREAQSICERLTPRLSHGNSVVVLSAVKVLMKFLELLPKDSDYYNMLRRPES
ncbi:AP-2 complex subunit beta-like isoform X1 [Manis pentadactyla]|uniref:AP-2 complex subunit beta-like isoform X2 n=2 Tax=Manis pentadactyla TaxID=143292 RepID=UPI00255C5A05|nr:AP-2 complex subunit beta-like isoform X2 [Manis pentadactyla]XP_057357184.1 AP-2 complex subunit beta-like isoform X1 [Manis pentadactyla]